MILTNNNGKSWGLNNGAESANDLSYSNISNIAKATQNIREKENHIDISINKSQSGQKYHL